ncbi:MAG: hypothetical protein FWD43_04630 [Coriobacteriia bacterium]|nr:hypothetical protein [Coriobacteriia bacterium]
MATYDLGGYKAAVDALSKAAAEDIERLLSEWKDYPDTASFRKYMDERMEALVWKYENAASSAAADRYEIWRKQILGESYGARNLEYATEAVKTYGLTHQLKEAERGKISDEDAYDVTKKQLADMVDRRINTAGRNTMRINSAQDDKSTGCASVPMGPTTCAFCLEMAALGVTYSIKVLDVEGRTFHDHCDCIFVPGFIGHSVKFGHYDSDAIREALDDVKRTLGYPINEGIKPEWEHEIRAELARRDHNWVMKGIEPEIDYSLLNQRERELVEQKEIDGYEFLKSKGFPVTVLRTLSSNPANIDILIGTEYWELKTPEGGETAIRRRLREAVSKWERLHESGLLLDDFPKVVLDNRLSRLNDAEALKKFRYEMNRLGVREGLFIGKDGSLIRS